MNEQGLSIRKNMAWNTIGSVVYLGLQWLIVVLVVRISSSYEAAGQLALAMAFATLFTPFAMYKIRAYQVSDVENEYTTGEYVGFRLVTIGVSSVVIIAYGFLTADFFIMPLIAFYVLFKALDVFTDVLHGVDQRNGRMDYIGQSFLMRGILTFVVFCGVLYISDDLTLAVFFMFVSTIPVLVFFDWKKARQFDDLKPVINFQLVKNLGIRCMPAVIASFCCSALTTLPRQYLALLFGDAALGIYSSVANPVLIIQMGASYLYSPLLVPFSKMFFSGKIKEFRALLLKVTVGVLAIGLAGAVIFIVFGDALLLLFYGESIAGNSYLLVPMLIATLLTAYIWLLSDLLILVRSMARNLVGCALAFAASIPFMMFFIPIYDMNGVSFAIIGASMVGVFFLAHSLMKALRDKDKRTRDRED